MAETSCSTLALAATMPPVNTDPVEHVDLRVLYDPFKPHETEKHELEWRPDTTLSDYLQGLPTEAEWMVFYNGEEVELEDAPKIPIARGDRIGLIVLPQGGGGMKGILRIVLQAAAIALMFVPGVGWAAALAINIGIGLINAFLLTPKPPKGQNDDEGRSYGIDGAKNSATEGIPYPVVYGEYRVAGNYGDVYTENVGEDQYLYLRTVINDGLIDSITDIEVNEQPVKNFKNVQTRIKLGTLTEDVNDWFRSSIVQQNKGIKLGTTWTTHLTSAPVDQVRFDVMFPMGLIKIDSDDGDKKRKSVTFEMQYRQVNPDGTPLGAGTYTPVPTDGPNDDYDLDFNNDGRVSFLETLYGAISGATVRAAVDTSTASSGGAAPEVQYREKNTVNWNTLGTFSVDPDAGSGYVFDDANDGSIAGTTDITPTLTAEFSSDLPPAEYEFQAVNGAYLTGLTTYPSTATGRTTVSDKTSKQLRKSFTSTRLNKGYYEVQIRRTTAQATAEGYFDEVHLTDVAEIDLSPVALRGTANLSLRIKLNEQLNNIPGLTAKVRGCILQKYDESGNPTVKEWSNNPAWIGLDILCSQERGAGMPLSRIDWPRWTEFANYCDANGLTFNGVFDAGTNIGDALRQVLRIGHAAPIPFGTKYSVAIDRKRDPVTMFTQASMIAKTFQVTYMSMQDRANEFEVNYFDKTDRNKQKTIRYVDPKAVTFNEMPRSASVSLAGVDNLAQAKAELWRMIYANRLLIRTISFEAWMEAINLTLGEVALIQHDQMEWANNGRLAAGSTTTKINLDQPVEMEAGESYNVLVHFSAIRRTSSSGRTVASINGNKVLVDANSIGFNTLQLNSKRLVGPNDLDFEIIKVENGSTYHTITLASAPTGLVAGDVVHLWDTDAVEERAVSSITQNGDGTTSVTLASALPAAPDRYANFVFGKVAKVRKPYALTGISGNGMEKRKLTFVEYHEGVYGPAEVEIPIPVEAVTDRDVAHVRNLLFDYETIVESGREIINARAHWNSGSIRNYGGADVYMALNGGPLRAIGSAVNVSEYPIQLKPGDRVQFKVIAYSTRQDRAPATTAPTVRGTIGVTYATLPSPTAVTAETTAFEVDGRVKLSWTAPVTVAKIDGYQVEYKRTSDTVWQTAGIYTGTSTELAGIPTGNWVARVRSYSNTSISLWVEKAFSVVVAPGSLMDNWTSSNDRNGAAIPTPTLPSTGVVEHTANSDGSANVSFEWLWSGDEATIDGFTVVIEGIAPSDNLAPNGDFSNGTTGWTAVNGSTISNVGGKLKVEVTTAGLTGRAYQGHTLTVGKKYRLVGGGSASGDGYTIRVGSSVGSWDHGIATGQVADFEFTPTVSTLYITLQVNYSKALGSFAEFDNIVLMEVV